MVSQYWGKKDNKNIAKVFGGNLLLGMVITVIFSLISLIFSKQVLGLYTNDMKIVRLGSEYLIINAAVLYTNAFNYDLCISSKKYRSC